VSWAQARRLKTSETRPALHGAIDGTGVKTQSGRREVKRTAFYKVTGRKAEAPRTREVSSVSSFEKGVFDTRDEFGKPGW